MRKVALLFLIAGILNLFIGVGQLLFPSDAILGNFGHLNDFVNVTQILVGLGFIYMSADLDRFIKPGK